MRITLPQSKRMHFLLNELGLMDVKADYCFEASKGRTWHSSELNVDEAKFIISKLQTKYDERTTVTPAVIEAPTDAVKEANKCNKLRRTIISKYREMGYNKNGKADMDRIKASVLDHWKKDFNSYDAKELGKILNVLSQTWLPHFYKKKNAE
jgi:hypothetical protein